MTYPKRWIGRLLFEGEPVREDYSYVERMTNADNARQCEEHETAIIDQWRKRVAEQTASFLRVKGLTA